MLTLGNGEKVRFIVPVVSTILRGTASEGTTSLLCRLSNWCNIYTDINEFRYPLLHSWTHSHYRRDTTTTLERREYVCFRSSIEQPKTKEESNTLYNTAGITGSQFLVSSEPLRPHFTPLPLEYQAPRFAHVFNYQQTSLTCNPIYTSIDESSITYYQTSIKDSYQKGRTDLCVLKRSEHSPLWAPASQEYLDRSTDLLIRHVCTRVILGIGLGVWYHFVCSWGWGGGGCWWFVVCWMGRRR